MTSCVMFNYMTYCEYVYILYMTHTHCVCVYVVHFVHIINIQIHIWITSAYICITCLRSLLHQVWSPRMCWCEHQLGMAWQSQTEKSRLHCMSPCTMYKFPHKTGASWRDWWLNTEPYFGQMDSPSSPVLAVIPYHHQPLPTFIITCIYLCGTISASSVHYHQPLANHYYGST